MASSSSDTRLHAWEARHLGGNARRHNRHTVATSRITLDTWTWGTPRCKSPGCHRSLGIYPLGSERRMPGLV
jgi:hypothetical protein